MEWSPPKWPWVDPEKDVNAEILAMNALIKSRTQVIKETSGLDRETVDQEIQEEQESERQKNLLAVAATNAEGLAFSLDSAINNTSIVSQISYGGKKMLFAGDAQYGNWQSWIGTAEAKQILASTDFFKVAHHGSENATPSSTIRRSPRASRSTRWRSRCRRACRS